MAVYDTVKLHVNKMDVSFPSQLYIDGQFVDATSGRKLRSIDPRDESVICEVECASKEDVDKACKAAHRAHAVSVYKCSIETRAGNDSLRSFTITGKPSS